MISSHGGHSAAYCEHAQDPLKSIVEEYVRQGFTHVCLTEHIPPPEDRFLYADERKAALTARSMQRRFGAYFKEARGLAGHYQKIEGATNFTVGFETEWYGRSPDKWLTSLIEGHAPDVIVASNHHVGSIPIDYDEQEFKRAVEHCGSLERLFAAYYDEQYELLCFLAENVSCPVVVGHLDLIYKFAPEKVSGLEPLISRNIAFAMEQEYLIEFNSRGGFPREEIWKELSKAKVTTSDDSHAVADVGHDLESRLANSFAQIYAIDGSAKDLAVD